LPSSPGSDPADLDFTSSSGFGGLARITGRCLPRDLYRAYLWHSVAARAPRDHLSHHRTVETQMSQASARDSSPA
jgi:hypothetical protein